MDRLVTKEGKCHTVYYKIFRLERRITREVARNRGLLDFSLTRTLTINGQDNEQALIEEDYADFRAEYDPD